MVGRAQRGGKKNAQNWELTSFFSDNDFFSSIRLKKTFVGQDCAAAFFYVLPGCLALNTLQIISIAAGEMKQKSGCGFFISRNVLQFFRPQQSLFLGLGGGKERGERKTHSSSPFPPLFLRREKEIFSALPFGFGFARFRRSACASPARPRFDWSGAIKGSADRCCSRG